MGWKDYLVCRTFSCREEELTVAVLMATTGSGQSGKQKTAEELDL
jgi:hypothetical protein